MKEVKAVLYISGDYCSFNEVSFSVEYVFGSTLYIDILDYIAEDLEKNDGNIDDIDFLYSIKKNIKLNEKDQEKLDNLVKNFVDKYEYDGYVDYTITSNAYLINDAVYINNFK